MTTYLRADEAAAILDVTKPTLYAYVSRGRLSRSKAPDGRTSLFARDEVEALADRSRRAAPGPRPTIDVQVASAVTEIDEHTLRYRGHDVATLATERTFEDVAELLWADDAGRDRAGSPTSPAPTSRPTSRPLTSPAPTSPATAWPALASDDRIALAPAAAIRTTAVGRLAVGAHVLAARHPGDDPATAARRMLSAAPAVLGSTRRTGPYALRLASTWRGRPSVELVDAVDAALVLLADHELATSTLAVRIAASVRADPYAAFAAGFAVMEGALHGAASAAAHRFLVECAASGVGPTIDGLRAARLPLPGFGHKVYRRVDPRFPVLMDHVRRLDARRVTVVDEVVAEAGRVMSHPPNVDLALGALTWAADLPPETPIFAVARIAGWGAHYAEELAERPVRFRGVAGSRR